MLQTPSPSLLLSKHDPATTMAMEGIHGCAPEPLAPFPIQMWDPVHFQSQEGRSAPFPPPSDAAGTHFTQPCDLLWADNSSPWLTARTQWGISHPHSTFVAPCSPALLRRASSIHHHGPPGAATRPAEAMAPPEMASQGALSLLVMGISLIGKHCLPSSEPSFTE